MSKEERVNRIMQFLMDRSYAKKQREYKGG